MREILHCLFPDVVEAFNSTSRYLDDLLNIDNPYLNKWNLFVCFVALRAKSTSLVIAGQSVHLTTLFPGQA